MYVPAAKRVTGPIQIESCRRIYRALVPLGIRNDAAFSSRKLRGLSVGGCVEVGRRLVGEGVVFAEVSASEGGGWVFETDPEGVTQTMEPLQAAFSPLGEAYQYKVPFQRGFDADSCHCNADSCLLNAD